VQHIFSFTFLSNSIIALSIMIKTRFAPSPTGRLHVGNARVALLNWLFTHQQGGQFLLRLDDTDEGRSTEEFAEGIAEDLRWLGLEWQDYTRQSLRLDRYQWAFETLKANGRLYPCYETQEELELKRKVQLGMGRPPLYDRAALSLTDAQRAAFEASGIAPHWRFKLNHEAVQWHDMVRGAVAFEGQNLSDPVLFRGNGVPIYTLASVMDDIDYAISHVIRGEDHVTNTALQIQVCEALGGTPPVYGHLSLMTDGLGQGLSKRLGSLSLQQLRTDGIQPQAINSLLARLGSADPIEPFISLEELLKNINILHVGRATPKFVQEELEALNARIIRHLPFAVVKAQLPTGITEDFWHQVQPNLEKLADAQVWWNICHQPITPASTDVEYTKQAANLLPNQWDASTWPAWIEAIKQHTGRKGKELFLPLRLALTARTDGPELPVLKHC
jgi:glutamyl-tRNA synthetase